MLLLKSINREVPKQGEDLQKNRGKKKMRRIRYASYKETKKTKKTNKFIKIIRRFNPFIWNV